MKVLESMTFVCSCLVKQREQCQYLLLATLQVHQVAIMYQCKAHVLFLIISTYYYLQILKYLGKFLFCFRLNQTTFVMVFELSVLASS